MSQKFLQTMRLIVYLLFFAFFLACGSKTTTVWNVKDYGAVGDGETLNTIAIQTAIDACAAAGGGKVLLEDGTFLSGTILLKNGVNLHIAEGATLLAGENFYDFQTIDPFVDATGQQRGMCLIGAVDAQNISITGAGLINGQGDRFTFSKVNTYLRQNDLPEIEKGTFDRPFLIRLVRSRQINISDIHLRQPAAWTLHLFQCAGFTISGVDIFSHANANNDGIDIDSSSDGVINNCTINTGDDAICFKTTSPVPTQNVRVRDCQLSSEWGAIKFGTESMGDFHNTIVTDCKISDTRGGGIKILSVDGGNISDVLLENIEMEQVEMPLFVRLGERLRTYRDAPQQSVGSIEGVTISNLRAEIRDTSRLKVVPPTGIFITGTKNYSIGSLTLENINIGLPGGGTKTDAVREVPDNEK
ncbi:MAG: glycoside hydrolase family 28 protein, partial [Bacteroidota bacterium]